MAIKTIGEVMSAYELANILEETAKSLKAMPNSIIRNVEEAELVAVSNIEAAIRGVANRTIQLEKVMEENDIKIEKAVDEHYKNTQRKIDAMNTKLSQLPKIENRISFPYGTEEFLKLAERYIDYDDKSWSRIIELATALSKNQEK